MDKQLLQASEKKARPGGRTKERTAFRREYILLNYLQSSDAFMASQLFAPTNTVKMMRLRMGLKRTVANVNGLVHTMVRRRCKVRAISEN